MIQIEKILTKAEVVVNSGMQYFDMDRQEDMNRNNTKKLSNIYEAFALCAFQIKY